MAVVDNAGTISMDAGGLHLNSLKITNQAPGSAPTDGVTLSNTLDQLAPPAANLNANSKRITSLADPVNDQDGSTKAYSDTPHPTSVLRIGSDFATGFTGALSGTVPVEGFLASVAGAGAAVTVLSTGNTDTIIGVAQCSTGTTAGGICAVVAGAGGGTTGGGTIRAVTTSKVVLDIKISIATLSTSTDTFITYAGTFDSVGTLNNGIYFSNDSNTDTHWIINTKSGGTGTSTATSVVVNAAQEYHLLAIKAAGADSVTFFIDGVNVGTIATNVPTTNNVQPGAALKKSLGANPRTCNVDWLYCTQIYQRAA